MDKDNPQPQTAAEAARRIKDSAQQIWLAGLGAFAQAQQQGSKAFETLVEDGLHMQRKTQEAAQTQMAEASQRLGALAGDLSSRAGQQWDRLEGIFEERVAKALQRLDVASRAEVDALQQRIDGLEAQLSRLNARTAPGKRGPARPGSRPAAKTTPKPAIKRSKPAA